MLVKNSPKPNRDPTVHKHNNREGIWNAPAAEDVAIGVARALGLADCEVLCGIARNGVPPLWSEGSGGLI